MFVFFRIPPYVDMIFIEPHDSCGMVHGDDPWSGNSSAETHFPTGSAARSPCSSVLTVQQITPTVPTPRANGIIISKVQYAGLCTGKWITISQPSIWTSPPANDDQFVAICDHMEHSKAGQTC